MSVPLPVRSALALLDDGDCELAVVRRGGDWVVGVDPEAVVTASGADGLAVLDQLSPGWWAGFLSYELGRAVERVTRRRPDDLGLPDVALARFESRLVVGPGATGVRVEGDGATRARLEAAARQLATAAPAEWPAPGLGPWSSSLSREAFEAGVRAVVELVRAGECYQVNLTRRLSCSRPADPVALFAALARHNPAPHAALVRLARWSVVSASPERFLRRRGDAVETRPMKGTAATRAALAGSAKDRAENVMITDLARNDLGRVCHPGTITVPALFALEEHPGLWQAVSTVTGRLRAGVGAGELIRATFPPASVTGAPKPRVLQAIEELEPVGRGVYCGAVGCIDAGGGEVDFNVAIRTFLIAGGATHLGVGGGITADSDPEAEWRETELKAARLLAAAGSPAPAAMAGAR
jgi:para-aminobenzoate synthetase component I